MALSRFGQIILLTATLTSLFILFLVPGAEASVAKVTISLDEPTSKVAVMEYGKETVVEFSGTISAKSLGNDAITIHLETVGQLPGDVEVEFDPSAVTLEGLTTQTASFSIRIGLGYQVEGDVTISVGIRGKWQVEGSSSVLTTNTERVEVRPTSYYGINISPKTPFISGSIDVPLAFPIEIISDSNTDMACSAGVKELYRNAFGVRTWVNGTAFPKGLLGIDDRVQLLECLSSGIVNILVDGSRIPEEWGVVEITVNVTVPNEDIVEEITFHAQSVAGNLTLFISDKSFLIAFPFHERSSIDIDDIRLPDRLQHNGPLFTEYYPELPAFEGSYQLTVGVLLIGRSNVVTLDVEEPDACSVSWEPSSIPLDHLEMGIFNITLEREGGRAVDGEYAKNMVKVRPTAPDSHSTCIYALIPGLKGSTQDGISTAEIVAMGGGVFILTALGLGKMEFSRFRILALFFFPLYSFIHEENALDHFTRGRIFQFIKDNPGTHYSRIRKELGLNNGVLSYHLQTLTRVELIKSKRHGTRKLFFITGTPVPEEITAKLNYMETAIRQMVRERPGITSTEIKEKFPEKSKRTISHYVKKLSRKDYIYMVREGRCSKCYPKEA